MSNRYELFIPAGLLGVGTGRKTVEELLHVLSHLGSLLDRLKCANLPGSIPPRAWTLDLTQEQQLVRDTVREFAREKVAPVAEELDRESRFPYEIVADLGELGLMGLPISEEYGGAGGDTVSYALAIEELTRIDSSVAITVAAHTSLGTMPIYMFGSEAQKQQWLPDLASGRKLAAFGLTEPGAGSDAGNTLTTAELRDGQWLVNGSKMFITNAGTDITWGVTLTARTGEDEISNIVVENGTPGYEISAPMKKLGWKASDTRELSFSDVSVPEGNLLGERGAGFHQFLEILDGGRISVAAMGVGLAQGAYDLAYAYAQERQQFGKPIARFQAVQFRLADMATEIEAGRGMVIKAAWLKDQGRPFAREAAMAKLYTGELSNRAANWALQIHGGYGFMDEYAISRLYRDQKILEIGEGTNEVQRMVIAKHARSLAGLDAFGERVAELAARRLPLLHRAGIRNRNRGQERLRVVVLRIRVDLLRRADLDELALVHHGDPVAHRADDGEVVRDEEVREAEVPLEVLEQVEDLRLDRDVERRDRLVADDQLRAQGERARDADSLALAARELVRIAVREARVEADDVEQLADADAAVAARADPVHDQRLADDVSDRHPRVERRVRVLEDDLHLAPHLAERFAAELRQLDALEPHRAGVGLRRIEPDVGFRSCRTQ